MSAPKNTPVQLQGYTCKQSRYNDVVPKLPMRSTLCGPSSSGKAVLLSNMTLDVYRLFFNNLYMESIYKFW